MFYQFFHELFVDTFFFCSTVLVISLTYAFIRIGVDLYRYYTDVAKQLDKEEKEAAEKKIAEIEEAERNKKEVKVQF